MRTWDDVVKPFFAGFVATLVFHQGMLALLRGIGATPRAPYVMLPTPPFGVPQVVSLAFWGGVWGIVLWAMIRDLQHSSSGYWTRALEIGALAPSAVALFIVFPLKGQPVAGGWDPAIIVGALLLNGAWGLGTAWLMRVLAPSAMARARARRAT
jgi:hypothetical protein